MERAGFNPSGFESPILHHKKHRRFVEIYGVSFFKYTL
nr:MAG TPA: hypothetical protein [Caudoviricetes sp.]